MRTLLIDSTNQFLRNYAVRPSLDKDGARNGGVFGMLSSLGYFCRILEPTRVILCWDGAGGSKKRRKIIPEYKHGRRAVKPARINATYDHEYDNIEENKKKQRQRLAEYLKDLPVTEIVVEDTEADDIVAYLAGFLPDEKIIISDDKDFLQLINKNTIVFRPTTKSLWTQKTLVAEHNIYPYNFAVAKAVVGDAGDNIKGVNRVGLITLVKWFPIMSGVDKVTIDDLIDYANEHIKDKNGKKYQKFIDSKELIERNYKAVQLHDPIIGFSSIEKVHEAIEKPVGLNATAMRGKFRQDDINSLGDNFFLRFKEVILREKRGQK